MKFKRPTQRALKMECWVKQQDFSTPPPGYYTSPKPAYYTPDGIWITNDFSKPPPSLVGMFPNGKIIILPAISDISQTPVVMPCDNNVHETEFEFGFDLNYELKDVANTSDLIMDEQDQKNKEEDKNMESKQDQKNEDVFSLKDICDNYIRHITSKALKVIVHGKDKIKMKTIASEDKCALQSVIHVLKATISFLDAFMEHEKCNTSTCSLCLVRSLIVRLNKSPRDTVVPHELILTTEFHYEDGEDTIESVCNNLFKNISMEIPDQTYFKNPLRLECKVCGEENNFDEQHYITLESKKGIKSLATLFQSNAEDLLKQHKPCYQMYAKKNIPTDFECSIKAKALFITLDEPQDLQEDEAMQIIPLFGRNWKISGYIYKESNTPHAIAVVCRTGDFLKIDGQSVEPITPKLTNVLQISLENVNIDTIVPYFNDNWAYEKKDFNKWRMRSPEEKEKAKKRMATDEEKEKNKKRMATEKEKEKTKKRLATDKEKENTRKRVANIAFKNLKENIKTDTGMDIICCSEMRWRSKQSSFIIKTEDFDEGNKLNKTTTFTEEQEEKYLLLTDESRSPDGFHYVCDACKTKIKRGQYPRTSEKIQQFLGTGEFPDDYPRLNTCEAYLLKKVIPFIRVAHLPRGPFFKVVGPMICVTADVEQTKDTIIPVEQHLIPVSLKRKLEYKGYYLQEVIDKNKILKYFQCLQERNHLYKDKQINLQKIDAIIDEALKDSGTVDEEKSDEFIQKEKNMNSKHTVAVESNMDESLDEVIVTDDIFEDFITIPKDLFGDVQDELVEEEKEDEEVPAYVCESNQSTVMVHNTIQNLDAPTVINVLAEVIRWHEKNSTLHDEFYESDSEIEDSNLENDSYEYEHSKTDDELDIVQDTVDEFYESDSEIEDSNSEKDSYEYERSKTDGELDSVQDTVEPSPKKAKIETRQKKRKAKSKKESIVSIAPGEGGELINFTNFEKFKYLEEECFPHLFPDGTGGYVSTYLSKGKQNPGLANYLKQRLYSVDPKFRQDSHYVMFATLLKEAVTMKNCEYTALRKAQRLPKYDKKFISESDKGELLRSNQSYKHYRAMRGFAPYYQSHGLDLVAFIRQQGTPQVYLTLSQAQLKWDELLLSILKTMKKASYKWSEPVQEILTKVDQNNLTLDFIKQLLPQDRRCLVVNNIQQVTQHFQRRVQKVFQAMKQKNFLLMESAEECLMKGGEKGGCDPEDCYYCHILMKVSKMAYSVSDYFIKTEFTAGGFPHVHCLCWLENQNELTETEIIVDGQIKIEKKLLQHQHLITPWKGLVD